MLTAAIVRARWSPSVLTVMKQCLGEEAQAEGTRDQPPPLLLSPTFLGSPGDLRLKRPPEKVPCENGEGSQGYMGGPHHSASSREVLCFSRVRVKKCTSLPM